MSLEYSLIGARTKAAPVSIAAGPVRRLAQRYPMPLYVLLAYGITTLGWLPSLLNRWSTTQTPLPLAILAWYGPTLAAFLVSALMAGRSGVKGLTGRFVPKGVGLGWYGLAAFGVPALYGLASLIHLALGRPLDFSNLGIYNLFPFPDVSPWLLFLPFSLIVMVTFGAMNEEFGWRGFLLPRLLERYSPLKASLILAPIWFAWHLPQRMFPGFAPQSTPLQFFVQVTALTILITWLSVNGRGSIFIAALFHTAATVTTAFFPSTLQPTVTWLRLGCAVLVVAFWLWRSAAEGRIARKG